VTELEGISGRWQDDGEVVRGSNTTFVRVEDIHLTGPGHVDIGFVMKLQSSDSMVFWDCVSGGERQDDAAAAFAARIWARTTAPAFFELATRCGDFADSSMGDATLGLAGWHSIHGPVLAYGSGDPNGLQRWMLDHPVVPLLGHRLRDALAPGSIHGVKILVGAFDEPIAEVRIDGVRDEACSRALLELPWPRATKPCAARLFVLFVHGIDRERG
jgi:hypothetical protein